MRYRIIQTDQGWELRNGDQVLSTYTGAHAYGEALSALGALLSAHVAQLAAPEADYTDESGAAPEGDGLLAEQWESGPDGICYSEETPSRDFSQCAWTSRDPAVSLLPLMLQTETDYGHFGAELAGYIESIDASGVGAVPASGCFYDSDIGRQARDLLLGGRIFGVSVDPTENYEVEFVCTETDDDGWCIDGKTSFLAYEIGGVTMTPFPALERASIKLRDTAAAAVTAGARVPRLTHSAVAGEIDVLTLERLTAAATPTAPPRAWFDMPEPQPGSDLLVEQADGSLAVPLTITDDGQVFGHIARWDQCHTGFPGQCVGPPNSLRAYVDFNVGGVVCDDGTTAATGALTVATDHAPDGLRATGARDHYANSGFGWADVHVTDGEFGPWACGALRPGIDDVQLRVLRALSLSGDWREVAGHLELIGVLAVNTPGFPIARQALAASALLVASTPMPSYRDKGGRLVTLVAAGMVTRCKECQKRASAAASPFAELRVSHIDGKLDQVLALVQRIERRTSHLTVDAAAALRGRLTR